MWNPKIAEITVHSDKEVCGFFDEYRWLSNFFPSKVMYSALEFPSVEHAYQSAKFSWPERFQFRDMTASQAKKKGQTAILPEGWDVKKFDVMFNLVYSKFTINDHLKERLIATGSKHLEETNWWGDQIWGVYNGVGENRLGKILMEVRSIIR